MATKLPRPSLVDTAIDTLRQSIEDGSWPVGHKLPVESTLAEQLGVSRNSVMDVACNDTVQLVTVPGRS